MGRRRRRSLNERTPNEYSGLPKRELQNWSLGTIRIESEFTGLADAVIHDDEVVWPNWAAWQKVYQLCRVQFIVERRIKHAEPVSERLYRVLKAGGDIDAELELIRGEDVLNDPRRVLGNADYLSGRSQQQPQATSTKKGKK